MTQAYLIGTVFQWGAALGVLYAMYRLLRYIRLGGYKPVPATIVRSEVVREHGGGPGSSSHMLYVAKIEYEYEYRSRKLKGTVIDGGGDIWTSSPDRANALCRKYPSGATVEAYVNPDKSADVYLERSPRAFVIGIAGTVVIFIIGTVVKGM